MDTFKTAGELGLPLVPGSAGAVETVEDARAIAAEIGYPVIIKATAGGGGNLVDGFRGVCSQLVNAP